MRWILLDEPYQAQMVKPGLQIELMWSSIKRSALVSKPMPRMILWVFQAWEFRHYCVPVQFSFACCASTGNSIWGSANLRTFHIVRTLRYLRAGYGKGQMISHIQLHLLAHLLVQPNKEPACFNPLQPSTHLPYPQPPIEQANQPYQTNLANNASNLLKQK